MPFFLPAIAGLLGGSAAAGGAAAGAAAAGGGVTALGAGGSMLAGAGASGAGAAGGGFWTKFGDWLGGDEQGSPMSALADFGDAMDRRNFAEVQQIPHPVPGGAPNTNPGLFGLQDLVAQSNRGGWGRI